MDAHTPVTVDRKSTDAERQAALQQIYHQVLERQPYESERKEIAKLEKDFLKGKLGVRHFIGELVMSSVYLDSFYHGCSNLKFIEFTFKHLLGRAIHNHDEVSKSMNLLMAEGVSGFFHEILGSDEYRKAFGSFTIPHPRDSKFYDSPRNYLQSDLVQHEHIGQRGKVVPTIYWQQLGMDCETGTCVLPEEMSNSPEAAKHSVHSASDRKNALAAIYQQVLERQPYASERRDIKRLEEDFLSGKLDVRHFIGGLVMSELYLNSFHHDFSNLKFMEVTFKHLLGRTLHDKEEISIYTEVLTKQGVAAFFNKIFDSDEYRKAFGCHTVPYARDVQFHDSPRNYLQSDLMEHEHAGQHGKSVPTMYWQELGMNCDTGTCVMPDGESQPQVKSEQEPLASASTNAKEPVSKALNEEIEELLQMLQNSDARQVLQSMNEKQKSLLRNLAQ